MASIFKPLDEYKKSGTNTSNQTQKYTGKATDPGYLSGIYSRLLQTKPEDLSAAYTAMKNNAGKNTAANTAQQYLSALQNGSGNTYKSPFADQLDAVLQQITGQGPFQYDAATDPLYQVYKDLYTQSGRRAMEDTIGQASALTGGYGNSYAQAAGQQQYNQYMEGLNAMIPQFQQQAYEQYKGEGDMLAQQYQILADADETAYTRYKEDREAAQYAAWLRQQAAQQAAQQAQGTAGSQNNKAGVTAPTVQTTNPTKTNIFETTDYSKLNNSQITQTIKDIVDYYKNRKNGQ